MAVTALSGPCITFGVAASSNPMDYNSQRGPSLTDAADGFLDPRVGFGYLPGAAPTYQVLGFYNNYGSIDVVLSSASSNAFAISSNTQPVAGTAVTLVPSTAKDTKTTTIIAPESGQTVTVICLGSTQDVLSYGSDGTCCFWNPAGIVGRGISITTSSSGDGGTWTVAGRDIYRQKMTETIATSSVTFTTQKAFKYISSITASTTITSTGVSIGLSDRIGMPLFTPHNGQQLVAINIVSLANSSATQYTIALTSANFVPASTAAVTTSTGADVRGTWTSGTASNSSLRFQITVTPPPSAFQSMTNSSENTYLFGLTQFSSV